MLLKITVRKEKNEIQNKVILVTAGGTGMGRELVLHLFSKDAKVIAIDINESTLQETATLGSLRCLTFEVRLTKYPFSKAGTSKKGECKFAYIRLQLKSPS